MNSKIALIVPYFGSFPTTFPFWLETCRKNPQITWLLFTDDSRKFDYPNNVIKTDMSLEELRIMFEQKLGFATALSRPYKLCDFRPLYGFLFEEQLEKYSHWGYCDVDLFFGNLQNFLDQSMLDEYDKINVLGHLSVYKNNQTVNRMHEKCDYKSILQDSRSRIFDEVRFEPNINSLMKANGLKIKNTIRYADIATGHFNFHCAQYLNGKKTSPCPYMPTIYHYNQGELFKLTTDDAKIFKEELAYVHFQKRIITPKTENAENFFLVSNMLIDAEPITASLIKRYSKDNFGYSVVQRFKRIKRAITSRCRVAYKEGNNDATI